MSTPPHHRSNLAQRLANRRAQHMRRSRLYRIVFGIAGTLVTLVGVAMLALPGPAFVVIPVGLAMLALEFEWAERALEKALLPIQGDYDVILVDTPPSLGLITVNALTASDGVIVPVQCEYLSLRGLVQLEHTLTAIRENLNPRVKIIGILPTMYDARSLHVREAVEILEENFGELVFRTRIRKTIRYAEAPVKGQSVLRYEPKGQAAEAYRSLAEEVLQREQA